jgi:hypothetical protein
MLESLMVNASATAGFLLLVSADGSGAGAARAVGWVLLALAMLAVVGRAAANRRVAYPSARLLVAAGAVVHYAREVPSRTDLLVLGAGAIMLLTLHEATLRRLPSGAPMAVNLPGLASPPRLLSMLGVFWVNVAATVLLAACALAELPTWVPFVVALVAAVAVVSVVVSAVRLRRSTEGLLTELRAGLEEYAPTFYVYFSGSASSTYQVTMWLPYLDRLGEPYAVVVRERHSLAPVAEATTHPVLVCGSLASLDAAMVPSLRAVFYVNNGMKNTHCVRFSHLNHVQLLHGDSDKPPSFSPVTAMYDRIFVAGQAGIDRYAANGVVIPREKFVIAGRPQVEAIKVSDRPVAEATSPTVLYAPTWQGHYADSNFCSLPVAEHLVRALLRRRVRVIVRTHPYSAREPASVAQIARICELLAADVAAGGPAHLWGEAAAADLSLFECFDLSDALLSDVSSVVSDYLYSQKPFALTDMLEQGPGFVAAFPVARAAYVVRRDMGNLDEILDQLLHSDPLAPVRREMRAYYLGDFPTDAYADGFLTAARAAVHDQRVRGTVSFVPEND